MGTVRIYSISVFVLRTVQAIRLTTRVLCITGNVAVHPLGKMLEVAAERRGESVVDCTGGSARSVVVGGDRHGDVVGSGSLSMFGVEQRGCLHT